MSDLPAPANGTVQLTSRLQVVSNELMALYQARGQLIPSDVVDAARPDDSPLHRFFEWDDSVAAERYRVLQAGQLVRSVKVFIEGANNNSLEVRSWVAVNRDGSGYQPTEVVGADPEQRNRVLRRMNREINSLRTRYGIYEEFWIALDAIKRSQSELAS